MIFDSGWDRLRQLQGYRRPQSRDAALQRHAPKLQRGVVELHQLWRLDCFYGRPPRLIQQYSEHYMVPYVYRGRRQSIPQRHQQVQRRVGKALQRSSRCHSSRATITHSGLVFATLERCVSSSKQLRVFGRGFVLVMKAVSYNC